MNKLTLFLSSLLMISASNAMNKNLSKQETQEPIPNYKITRIILGNLKKSNPESWCKYFAPESDNKICHPLFKKLATRGLLFPDAEGFYEANLEDHANNIKEIQTYFSLRKHKSKTGAFDFFDTTFLIEGAQEIEQFEHKLGFEMNKFSQEIIAYDDKTECRRGKMTFDDSGETPRRLYTCSTKISFDRFCDEMNNRPRFRKILD